MTVNLEYKIMHKKKSIQRSTEGNTEQESPEENIGKLFFSTTQSTQVMKYPWHFRLLLFI